MFSTRIRRALDSRALQNGRPHGRGRWPDHWLHLWFIQHSQVRRSLYDDNSPNDENCRGGAGPRGFMATLSQYMLSSAATFSFFLAIGSVSASIVQRKKKTNLLAM